MTEQISERVSDEFDIERFKANWRGRSREELPTEAALAMGGLTVAYEDARTRIASLQATLTEVTKLLAEVRQHVHLVDLNLGQATALSSGFATRASHPRLPMPTSDQNVSERVSDEQLATVAEQDGDEWVRMIAQAGRDARSRIASLQAELESVKKRNAALEGVVEAAGRELAARRAYIATSVTIERERAAQRIYNAKVDVETTLDALTALETTDGK